jgi:hypothetical protein
MVPARYGPTGFRVCWYRACVGVCVCVCHTEPETTVMVWRRWTIRENADNDENNNDVDVDDSVDE